MTPSFELKLARAKRHLRELDDNLGGYIADDATFSTRTMVSTDGKQHSIMVTLHDAPREDWGLAIGDTVHNLRCALDHIVWHLANPGDRGIHTMFPIYTDADTFTLGRANRKGVRRASTSGLQRLKGVEAAAIAVIEASQPYQPGQTGFGLNVLNQLENLDKHREIHTVAGVFQDIQPVAFPNLAPQETVAVEVWRQALEVAKEAEVFRLSFGTARAALDMKVYTPFEVVFFEPPVVEGYEVRKALRACVNAVDAVVNDLAPFV
jgi:hypothetical protein